MAAEEPRDLITSLNRGFARIGGWSFDNRWVVVLAGLALFAGTVYFAMRAEVDSSYEAYFAPDDPVYLAYEQFREDFGSDEISYVLYEVPGVEHGPWNLEIMRKLVDLTTALEDEVPFIYEVNTLVNAELTEGVPDGIDITEIGDEFPETQAELLALRERYLAKPLLVGGLLSADARYGAIVIEMDRSSTDPLEDIRLDPEGGDGLPNLYPQVTDTAIDEILARPEYADIAFYHSGDVPLNAYYNRVIDTETGTLMLYTAGIIAVMLSLFFRSPVGILGPLVAQLSVLACVAFIVLVGWKLGLGFTIVPTMLTAIGVAHSVHILSEFRARFAELGDRREALVQTLYLVGAPCLLTSLTTAAGFAAMSFVPIRSLAEMGIYGAVGVLAAFVLSFTLLVAFLSFGRRAPKLGTGSAERVRAKGGRWMQAGLGAVADFDVRHRKGLLVSSVVIFVFAVVGMTRLVVDSNWLNDFRDGDPIKEKTVLVDQVMGGLTNVVYLFDTGEPGGIKNPAALREIERVQEIAERQGDFVRKAYSIVDILKDLNQAFHGGDPAYYRIPETRELVAQYLVLYEMSGGEEAEEYVSSDYRRAQLELRVKLAMTSATAELVAAIDAELAARPLEATNASLTGIGALWIVLLDYIVSSQIQGFLLAFSVIAVMMCFIFRSVKTGLISMVPNLAPVVLTLGAMGWFGILLDYNKVMIAAVAIGIAVDDTIHLVSRYHHEFRLCRNYEKALRASMQDVGRALFITSVALVAGFLMLLFSALANNTTFGLLLASTILVALVADFLLMPALVLTFKPFGPEGARVGAPDLPHREAA